LPRKHEPYLSTLSEEALISLGSMEGFGLPPVTRAGAVAPPRLRPSPWPGYGLAALVAATAYGLHWLPPLRLISASSFAILVGLLVRNLLPVPASLLEGPKMLVRRLEPLVIASIGAGLNLGAFATVGLPVLGIIVLGMGVTLASAYYFGRAFRLLPKTAVLIGTGTAICGTNAIMAVSPLIGAEDEDMVLSIGTINFLGLILMFTAPVAGRLLGLPDSSFGVWAGASIHTVPQVVAAGFAFSQPAGSLATLIKLVRVSLLAPLVVVLAAFHARQNNVTVHYARLIPKFAWGFLALALLNTFQLFPTLVWGEFSVAVSNLLMEASNLGLTVALASIGLEVNVRMLARVGLAALLTGAAASILLCVTTLGLIHLLL
jgi:uncharacterized integral membrane protein (TIGR00698 family)